MDPDTKVNKEDVLKPYQQLSIRGKRALSLSILYNHLYNVKIVGIKPRRVIDPSTAETLNLISQTIYSYKDGLTCINQPANQIE